MRQIYVNENLSNKILQGEGRQSYFGNCNLENTKFIGDWRGTDYINNTGGADWTQADTYLSYWRGNDLIGAKFPKDIGCYHHEPPMEMFRIASLSETNLVHKKIMETIHLFLKDLYSQGKHGEACLCRVYVKALETASDKDVMAAFDKVVAPYEQWVWYLDAYVRGGKRTIPYDRPSKIQFTTHLFDKGQLMDFDKDNLPSLTRPNDRYELARKLEQQAKLLTVKDSFFFINCIDPPAIRTMQSADEWLKVRYKGY